MHDRWNRFIGGAFKNNLIENKCRINPECETTENPQATSVLERIHQVISNHVHMFYLQNNYLDEDSPSSGIIGATSFMVQSTYHTTLQSMPVQLVFRRGMILSTPFIFDWGSSRRYKQELIYKNNQKEYRNSKMHNYIVHNKVLL